MPRIVDRFRASTLRWLVGSLAGWGTILLALAGIALMIAAGGGKIDVAPLLPLVLPLAALAIVAWRWLGNLGTTYEIAEDRLILHTGIIAKSIDEVELYRVKNVRLDFSIINQIADIGTITLASSDETTRAAPLAMRDIAHARARRETLRELVNAARLKRGVRELDIAPEVA